MCCAKLSSTLENRQYAVMLRVNRIRGRRAKGESRAEREDRVRSISSSTTAAGTEEIRS